jgi:hypothetical protein
VLEGNFAHGEFAEGIEYIDGEYNGKGKLRKLDGNLYDGEFVNGVFNGKVFLYGSDFTYEGDMQDNKYNGYGILKKNDGTIYEGEF